MKVKSRLQEADKQLRLGKAEVKKSDVSQELEQSIDALQSAMELLDD